jgi:phosphoribosylglycinamide formyltransferase-1
MSAAPLRVAVLASGRGSNLKALLDAIAAGTLEARIVGVFSDQPGCGAIALARAQGLHAVAIRPKDCASRAAHDEALFSEIAAVQPDLIVFAGYMRIVGAAALHRFEGKMINIHPSLLPKYPGLDTHARALAAGDAEHGASVHAVTPELDAGPLISQVRIPVRPGDDATALAARLLAREHALLRETARLFAQRWISLHPNHVQYRGRPLEAPLQLDDNDTLSGA